jgi:hypothetical protein
MEVFFVHIANISGEESESIWGVYPTAKPSREEASQGLRKKRSSVRKRWTSSSRSNMVLSHVKSRP